MRKSIKLTYAHTETNLASGANDEKLHNSEKSEFLKIKKNGQSDSWFFGSPVTAKRAQTWVGVDHYVEILELKNQLRVQY